MTKSALLSKSNTNRVKTFPDPARIVFANQFVLNDLTEGANGDGMGIVLSLRSFDREQQKEFHVPIVIKDSGNPAISGTSTLTVIIGDVNDNKMQPGSKEIFAYNYMVILHDPSKSSNNPPNSGKS